MDLRKPEIIVQELKISEIQFLAQHESHTLDEDLDTPKTELQIARFALTAIILATL